MTVVPARAWRCRPASVPAIMLVRHPTANIRIVTHDIGDPTPRKIEAAVDTGVFALSVLVTWTARSMAIH